MDWLTKLTGETRARLLGLLRKDARSISELAAALAITDNAVRTHVAALERDGLVQPAGTQRATGGKPARLYELTPEAEELFPKAYAPVFNELIQALVEEEGAAAAVDHLRRVGRRLGRRAPHSHGDPSARVEDAAEFLESLGASVEVAERPDGWTIRASGCLLSAVVAVEPSVCALAESLIQEVTGLPTVECCERSARPRCAFRIAATASTHP